MHGNFSQLVLEGPTASRVLQQQGRVLLDADWNAACAVLLRAHRELAADLIGPHGGPDEQLGFGVSRTETGGHADIAIEAGVYYVDGIRVELDQPTTWSRQPQRPWLAVDPPSLPDAPLLVYLDVWERHTEAMQDDSLREVGLGGPDTTSRVDVVWQVRLMEWPAGAAVSCGKFPTLSWRDERRGTRPRLRAWVGDVEDDDPCLAAPGAGYRGVENQLYRVEVTDVDADGKARFLWSRENGSVTGAWVGVEGDRLVVDGLRDRVRGFAPGDWLELTWDRVEAAGRPGPRVRVVAVDGRYVTYHQASATGPVPSDVGALDHPIARRWDARPRAGLELHAGAIDIEESDDPAGGTLLEDGIRVQFALPPDGAEQTRYRVGDYWTIPARVATGGILWPTTGGMPDAVEPQGVEHHYAPLARLGDGSNHTDLRRSFAPLAKC